MNLEQLRKQIKEAQSKVAEKFQQGGLLPLSRKSGAMEVQKYRTNPNAKFKSSYFMDSPGFHQTYEPVQGALPNTYVAKVNEGLESEHFNARSGNQTGTGHSFTSDFLDSVFRKPIATNRPTMPEFKASQPTQIAGVTSKPGAAPAKADPKKPDSGKYSASRKRGGVLESMAKLNAFLNGKG